jgi:hypothetical protein
MRATHGSTLWLGFLAFAAESVFVEAAIHRGAGHAHRAIGQYERRRHFAVSMVCHRCTKGRLALGPRTLVGCMTLLGMRVKI